MTDSAARRGRPPGTSRRELEVIALRLFAEQGFEETTVDEIAGAVDISPRTFFRYFTSKEDLALAPLNQQLTAFLAAFSARPGDEAVTTALRRAAVGVLEACEAGADGFDVARFCDMHALLARSPALRAVCPQHGTALLDELAGAVGARMGVDPVVDPRPHLVASVVTTDGRVLYQSATDGERRFSDRIAR